MTSLHPSNPYYNATPHVHRSNANNGIDLLSGPVDDRPPQPMRSQSIATSTPSTPFPPSSNPFTQQRKTSTDAPKPSKPAALRTRSIGGLGGGVYFERDIDLSPPNDDEIIIATVRVTDSFRRASIEENAALPARPPRRSFFKRVSTRVSTPSDRYRYLALKMPRKDYKRYFARDREGNYAGTDPERGWGEDELQRMFSQFQDMPLRSIPGGQEYGEGVVRETGESEGDKSGNGDSPNRNDSLMATSPTSDADLSWAAGEQAFKDAAKPGPAVVWPNSIWT